MNPLPIIKRHAYPLFNALLLFVLLLPLVIHGALWGWSTAGAISSLASAALFVLLAATRPPLLVFLILVIWSILQSATVELVLAVGRMPSITDAAFLTDHTFVQQSLAGNGLAHPAFILAMVTASIAAALVRFIAGPIPPSTLLRRPCFLILILSPLHPVARQWNLAAEPWKQYDILHKLAAETASYLSRNDDTARTAQALKHAHELTRSDLTGKRLIDRGMARNVLLVILEGTSGSDITQLREVLGYQPAGQPPMPLLSAFALAHDAMQTPDFVVHNHQTIRGLYSILCGDYPKLDFSTPKATELLAVKEIRDSCLPAQLGRHGFATEFLQAAELAFMSKDKVMPHIGFETTRGKESITPEPGSGEEIVWGWDDKAFFSGALQTIATLEQKNTPWFLALLTVGTHQPYGAPRAYLDKYKSPALAAITFLDEAVAHFLSQLREKGVFENTLVIVTSDEAHGTDLRLVNAWGLSLIFAPEHDELPALKKGVYGQIDLAASILDYFELPVAPGIAGRSLFRDYDSHREILSYTNGVLRHLNKKGHLTECDLQEVCREYDQRYRFILPQAAELRRYSGADAKYETTLAGALNRSISLSEDEQNFQFADGDRRQLKPTVKNDWSDNLIGAQYLDFGKGTRTSVSLRIKALHTDSQGAALKLRFKEFDKNSAVEPPELPLLHNGEELSINFAIDNPMGRKGFSFHLLGEGHGEIEIDEFRVNTRRIGSSSEGASATDLPSAATE